MSGVFASALIGVYDFRENLRAFALYAMPSRAQGNGHQNRQHNKERLGDPEREEDFEEKTFHLEHAFRCWPFAKPCEQAKAAAYFFTFAGRANM
jgi:hypothetical protein